MVAREYGDEVVLPEQHPAAAERLSGHFPVVPAHGAQEHALALESREQTLKNEMPVAASLRGEGNAFHSVLCDDPSPEHVIKIGDQDSRARGDL